MTVPRRGWRRIDVDGARYTWSMKRARDGRRGVVLRVCRADRTGQIASFFLSTDCGEADIWTATEDERRQLTLKGLGPSDVRRAILSAIENGWSPGADGPTIYFDLPDGRADTPPMAKD